MQDIRYRYIDHICYHGILLISSRVEIILSIDSESSRPPSAATSFDDNQNRLEKFSKTVGHHSSGYSSMSSSATKKYVAPKPPVSSVTINDSKRTPDVKAKKRMAPPPPLPARRQIVRDSTKTQKEILDGFIVVGDELFDLETKGRILEEKFDDKTTIDEEFLDEWVLLCEEKMRLIRKQNDFAFFLREKQLNELHTEVEYQLRCLIEKPVNIGAIWLKHCNLMPDVLSIDGKKPH
uniref:BMERB domain-containing protein n=1 Tax=Romanomermis culicivorax TaxID=13658 RepID=A0A915KKD3_ROMCU